MRPRLAIYPVDFVEPTPGGTRQGLVVLTHDELSDSLPRMADQQTRETKLSKRGAAPRNVPPPPRPQNSIPKPPSSHSAGRRFRGMITISESKDAYRWVICLDEFKDAGSVTLVMVPLVTEERDPGGAR